MFPLKDRLQLPGFSYVTYALIAINAYVFYMELATLDLDKFISLFALVPAQFSLSNPLSWYPLATSQFLHGGWFHILTNMWFLLVFGPNLERAWGWKKFLPFYLLGGVAAALLQLLFTNNPAIPIVGASGAIAAVLGAYFVYFPHHRITTLIPLGFIPFFIGVPAGIILIYWFGLQLAGGLVVAQEAANLGGVAFFAHIGGFLAGVLFAVASTPPKLIKKHSPFV